MDTVTPAGAFKWAWIACATVGGVLVLLGLVTVSEYGVAAGFILAAIWGPILGIVASAVTWAIRAVIVRLAH
jgi:FtsH-binding integral membrane protein